MRQRLNESSTTTTHDPEVGEVRCFRDGIVEASASRAGIWAYFPATDDWRQVTHDMCELLPFHSPVRYARRAHHQLMKTAAKAA